MKHRDPMEMVAAHAAIGRIVVAAVKESGLLRVKRRPGRKRKAKAKAERKPRTPKARPTGAEVVASSEHSNGSVR